MLTGERNEGDDKEGRDGISQIVPVDLGGVFHHERSNNDQNRSSGPSGNVGQDGREENGDEEPECGCNGGETGLSTFGNTTCRFDKGCAGRGTEKQTRCGDASGIDEESDGTTFKVTVTHVVQTGLFRHGDKGSGGVKEIDIEE